jgi:uncharacterized protein (TIGR01777 family)
MNKKLLLSGSGGFIGSALVPELASEGYRIVRLVRTEPYPAEGTVSWDPLSMVFTPEALEGLEAVVHLAGENVASGRWTQKKKWNIWHSRVRGTQILAEALGKCKDKPKVFVGASAIGFYGDRGEEVLTEESPPGVGFFPDLCRAWESAAQPLVDVGVRVVHLRIGVVLGLGGGALARMVPPFRWGLGGRLGSGRQYMSWIALPDVVGAVSHVLRRDDVRGPVNLMAPNPLTNAVFTKTLGRVLDRPTFFPVPEFAIRAVFGEMGENLLLASTRAEPAKLLAGGYRFRFPELETALRHLLENGGRN